MNIYAVEITTLGEFTMTKLHPDAYRSYDRAEQFINSRNDKPEKVDDFNWKSEHNSYTILQLNLKK